VLSCGVEFVLVASGACKSPQLVSILVSKYGRE
jgi:hypothetical protein